jgi:hypothetical protein
MNINIDGDSNVNVNGANINLTADSGLNIVNNSNLTPLTIQSNTAIWSFSPIGTLTAPGNISANYFIGNGALLTGLAATYSNTDVFNYLGSNSNVVITTTGDVTAANITSTANISGGNVSVTSNITAGNVRTSNLTLSGNLISSPTDITIDPRLGGNTVGTLFVTGNLQVSGNITYTDANSVTTDALQYISANNAINAAAADTGGLVVGPAIAPYATWTYNNASNSWISNINISTPGNVTAANFVGNGSALTGMYANSNVFSYLGSNSNAVITTTANITTTGNVSGNFILGNGANLNLTDYTGPASAGYVYLNRENSGIVVDVGGTDRRVGIMKYNGLEAVIAHGSGSPFRIGRVAQANILQANANTFTSEIYITSGGLVGINTQSPTSQLTVVGNIAGTNFIGNGSALTGMYSNASVAAYLPTYSGNLGNVGIANSLGIVMGTPTQGNLVSNAVTLTTTTALSDGIALLNRTLGKLVPPSPPAFPASQTLSISGLATYRMSNIVQTNNTANSLTVSAGATVTNVLRSASYSTNTIATAGPGDTGTVTAYRNNAAAGNVTLTGSSNGTYGNLIISANQDYNVSNSSIPPGFWFVFSAALSGNNTPAGWNDVRIVDSAAGSTNVPSWYYDNSAPGTPTFSGATFAVGSNTLIYTSTVPHYTSATQFNVGFTVANVSGNTYPTSNTFVTGTAVGAFQSPVSVTYAQSSLASNIIPAFANATVTTTAAVATGFGSSNVGPNVSVTNSYATGTQSFAPGAIVLFKTGTTGSLTFLEESNIFVGGTIGAGVVGSVTRIVNPGSTDTPVYTGNIAAFNSTSGPLQSTDAAVVANILSCNRTNYSTGYLPVGPNLSAQATTQYFTFKFTAPSTSKFDVYITGTIAGLYVALPGSGIDTSSTLNGWMDASIAYAGSGQPGAGAGGNGSNGCALGGVVPINTAMTARRTTCTFGTTGTAASTGNQVYVRIKLTVGQSITSLAIYPASN